MMQESVSAPCSCTDSHKPATRPRCTLLGVHGDRPTDRDMHVKANTHSTHLQDSALCRHLHNGRHTVSMT